MFVIAQDWQGGKRYWQRYDKGLGDSFVFPIHKDHAAHFSTREEAEAEAEYIAGGTVEEA